MRKCSWVDRSGIDDVTTDTTDIASARTIWPKRQAQHMWLFVIAILKLSGIGKRLRFYWGVIGPNLVSQLHK